MKDLKRKLTSKDIELALVRYFKSRECLILPNVSWSMFHYEMDMIIITRNGYGYEIEIKVTKSDIIKDKDKRHSHNCPKIKFLYFAIPKYLETEIDHIPEIAGIITVDFDDYGFLNCKTIRRPKPKSHYIFADYEKYNLARLGTMRMWNLKRELLELYDKFKRCAKSRPKGIK